MRYSRHRALPHPLLSPLSSDVSPNVFAFECGAGDITCDRDHWTIGGRLVYDCPELAVLVQSGKAVVGIHVECPRTFYRQWHPQNGAEVCVSLPANGVRGKVEMLAMCVAFKDIPDYTLQGQHEDYTGSTFDIGPGDLLAVARDCVEFDAYLDLDPIRKISSILDIRRSAERSTGAALIDFDDDRVQVELSQDDYQTYIELRADPSIRGLVASNVVFPAVLQAVQHLGRLTPEELDEAKANRRWCRSLVARLDKAGIGPDAPPEEVFRVTQEILRGPVHRGMWELRLHLNGDQS
jgi:hypothetical protein